MLIQTTTIQSIDDGEFFNWAVALMMGVNKQMGSRVLSPKDLLQLKETGRMVITHYLENSTVEIVYEILDVPDEPDDIELEG